MLNPVPKLVISPMAGVTDAPFRHLALRFGADLAISEMITSQTHLWESRKTQQRLKSNFIEKCKIIQIAGATPQVIAEAAAACADIGANAIEINMGCPAKKVCNVLAGSALLRDESLVGAILTSAVNATRLPVYLKTRLGWDHQSKNINRVAKLAEDCGIQALAIHGRTRSDYYTGLASYDLISQVKSVAKIPVYANGDITSPQIAAKVLAETNCDGLYIGRAALGQPWLFHQIKEYLATGKFTKINDANFIKAIMSEHVELIHQHYGLLGVRIARKHVKWYLKANTHCFENGELVFSAFSLFDSPSQQLEFLNKL